MSGITAVGGENGNRLTANYIYGITPVSDELKIDTLLAPNWPTMEGEGLGQCMPLGWRVNFYDDNGAATTSVASGTANMGSGCRLFYFPAGGDFTAGFYLSAREYAKALLSYGRYSAYRLTLPVGDYELTFRSTYWSTGSQDGKASFNVALHPLSSNAANIFEDNNISPRGCQAEDLQKKPTGTALHSYTFNVAKKDNYALDFTMTQGWNSILLADVTIVSGLSIPERYKGTFHRLLLKAAAVCDGDDNPALAPLREALEKYRDFASTSPTEYEAAIAAMQKAFASLPTTVSAATAQPVPVRYYSLDGRQLTAPSRGITIERQGTGTRKVVRK